MSGARMLLGNGRTVECPALGRRAWARVLDTVVLSPAILLFAESVVGYALASFGRGLTTSMDPGLASGYELPGLLSASGWAGLAVLVLYEPVTVACWGATLGKLAMGIKLVCFADGARASTGAAWIRAALPTAAGLATLGAGWLAVWCVLWVTARLSPSRRGAHDGLAGTVVVTRTSWLSVRSQGGTPGAAAIGSVGVAYSGGLATPAGLTARLGAKMLDVLAATPVMVLGVWVLLAAAEDSDPYGSMTEAELGGLLLSSVAQWAPRVALLAAVVALYGLTSMARRGATAGRCRAGVRIVRSDGCGSIGLIRSLLRWAVSAVPLAAGAAAALWMLWRGPEGGRAAWWTALLPIMLCLAVWALVRASALWDPDRRGWNDKLAGTIVVSPGLQDQDTAYNGDSRTDHRYGADGTDSDRRATTTVGCE